MSEISTPKENSHAFRFDMSAFETRRQARRKKPRGEVYSVPAMRGGLEYFAYYPETANHALPPFVSIHGISRNAAEHMFRFRMMADQYGVVAIAPVFPRRTHRHFHKFGCGVDGLRADDAFTRTLQSASAEFDIGFDEIRLFGHSAGGQFSHRYLMANPKRARRAAIFAPGWYTFPMTEYEFPIGIGGGESPIEDLSGFLEINLCVFVGDRDTTRDSNLRSDPVIDALQGRNRVERARAWTAAVRQAATGSGIRNRLQLSEISGAGHLFSDNCINHQLTERVFAHLYESTT